MLDAVEGTVGVIAAMADADRVAEWLSGSALTASRSSAACAKGMEYDG
jgi:hypothetical protein